MKAIKVVLIIIVVLAIVIFAAGWYFSSVIIYVERTKCNKNFYYCGDPSEFGIPYRNVEFKASDGLLLRGWYVPAANSTKAVIFLHGHGANRREGLRFLHSLHDAGFNFLTFDFRSAGESEGKINSMGYHERKDAKAALDFLVTTMKMKSIGVFGVSQGGATGILLMAEDPRIKAGVFEASYASMVDIVAEVGKREYKLPRFPLIPIVFLLFELRGDVDTDILDVENYIGKISPRPVYIIHCKADNYTAYSHAERLMKAAKEPKMLWTAPCTSHAEAWQADRKYMENSVTAFFRKNLR